MCKADDIRLRIEAASEGSLFFVSDFSQGGNEVYISHFLSELVETGHIERLGHGIYFKPKKTMFGTLRPNIEQVVEGIARRDKAQIMPTGQTSEYLLGLSTQIPLNYVYLTSGSARTISLGNNTVIFKRCVPKNFAFKGKLMPILVQAMKSIGQCNIEERHLQRIKELLRDNPEPDTFDYDLQLAPIWIKKTLTSLIQDIRA